jgi:predicted RNA binding protein YcfA (HicA-like mRNA interferase family)
VKIPRDPTGRELARGLGRLGYEVTRQTGSHIRLTTERGGTHHVTIPTTVRCEWERFPPCLPRWEHITASIVTGS